MNSYSLEGLVTSCINGESELSLMISCPTGDAKRVYFKVSGCRPAWANETFVLSTLIASMARSFGIASPGVLDREFIRGANRAQMILNDWVPALAKVSLGGQTVTHETLTAGSQCSIPPSQHTLAFFSGGVDSFYTLYENLDTVSALVFVAGFSPALKDKDRCERALMSVQTVAESLGKQLVVVTTNLREFMEEQIPATLSLSPWELAHGTALAAVAHLLAGDGGTILVPASFSHLEGVSPWGSHPLLDPLWSSRCVRIKPDGYWATRQRKIESIAKYQQALDHLIVCYRCSTSGKLNCGTCEKCVRTMIGLLVCGALDRCHVFEHALEAEVVATSRISRLEDLYPHECNLLALEQQGIRPDIQKALRNMIRRSRRSYTSFGKRVKQAGAHLFGGCL